MRRDMSRMLLFISLCLCMTCLSIHDEASAHQGSIHQQADSLADQVGCMNPDGEVVDWWVSYQIPGSNKIPRFYYYDVTYGDKGEFTFYDHSADAPDTPLRRTIHQLNSKPLDEIIWNGQIENKEKPKNNPLLEEAELNIAPCSVESEVKGYNRAFGTQAHSKFFIGVNKEHTEGFGVVNSIPHFPKYVPKTDKIDEQIGRSQRMFGQHLLCFTLKGKDKIKRFLDNTCNINPEIFYDTMPVTLDTDTQRAQYRAFFKADDVDHCSLSDKPNFFHRCEVEDISKKPFPQERYSLGADDLRVYYKNGFMPDQPADMFQHLVSQFQSDILLQTWGRPRPYADTTFQVDGQSYQVKTKGYLQCKECKTKRGPKKWCGSMDHSKWLITDSPSKHISCFGDLNRNTEAQLRRGGAFYCLEHKGLHKALKNIITDTPCATQQPKEV